MTYVLELPRQETERLVMRGWRESDLECVIELLGDEEHARFIGGKQPRWRAWRTFAALIGHYYLRGFTFFAVEEKATGRTIGWAGPWFPEGWPEKEIGYSFIRSANGKGYATEAATAMIRYVYDRLDWPTAISLIDQSNRPSQKVAQRLGATKDGETLLFETEAADIWRHLPPAEFRERFQ